MSRRPLINVGDLITACAHTGAADEESVRTIARMLGLTLSDQGAALERSEPVLQQEPPSAPSTESSQEPKSPPPSASSEPAPSLLGGERLSIVAVTEARPGLPPPAWLGQKLSSAPPAGGRQGTPLKLDPLLLPSWTRNLIASAVAAYKPEGPLQIDALVKLLGERRPIRRLPRQLRSTLRAGAQVLVDRSETMEPFSRDVEFLLERIPAVVGRERAQVLFFEGSPRQSGVGSRREWQAHRFQPETPILALTCLDINAAPHRALATALAWMSFADAARDARCPLVALVPYPPSRWPEGLAERMVILEWDRGTTVGHARRVLRRRGGTV